MSENITNQTAELGKPIDPDCIRTKDTHALHPIDEHRIQLVQMLSYWCDRLIEFCEDGEADRSVEIQWMDAANCVESLSEALKSLRFKPEVTAEVGRRFDAGHWHIYDCREHHQVVDGDIDEDGAAYQETWCSVYERDADKCEVEELLEVEREVKKISDWIVREAK